MVRAVIYDLVMLASEWYLTVVSLYITLVNNDAEHRLVNMHSHLNIHIFEAPIQLFWSFFFFL